MAAPVDGRQRPRVRGIPRTHQLLSKVPRELYAWVQGAAREAGVTASQWLLALVEEARARDRPGLPRADAAGVTLLVTGEGVELLLRPIATGELELALRAGALSLGLPLDESDLRRAAAVLEREAGRLRGSAAVAKDSHAQEEQIITDPESLVGARHVARPADNAPTKGRGRTTYFLTPGPGFYGADATVISSHRTRFKASSAADRLNQQAGRGRFVVRLGSLRKGDLWIPAYESQYALVWP